MKVAVSYLGADRKVPVGELFERDTGRVFFEYDSSWAAGKRELSPVYLGNDTRGALASPTPLFGPLFGLFSDSLPDWWGEQLMKRFFADQGIPWGRVTALQKLACQGVFGMGVLGYEPDLSDGVYRDVLTIEIGEMVQGAMEFASGSVERVLPALVRSGLSPGGAQPKVLLGFSDDLSEVVAGGGALPDGFGSWLLKFDLDRELELGKEEFAYARMAEAAGIDLPETRLLETEGGRFHFLIRRFDRDEDQRIHMHSYAGLTHTHVRESIDYHDIMNATRVLTRREPEVEKVFRRAVFNIAAGNDDDHGKNHSFLMDGDGEWRVSPAYDLTRSSNPLVAGIRAAAVLGNSTDVVREDLVRLGERQGVRKIEEVIDQVVAAVRDWERWAGTAGLGRYRTRQIGDELPALAW